MCRKEARSGNGSGNKNIPAGGFSNLIPPTVNIWGYFWGYIKKDKLIN
jgi:hypothetical protein